MQLILGSASKWRQQLLKEAGYIFSVMSSDFDEQSIRDDDPKQLALKLAKAKAEVLLPQINTRALLITADQVVVCHQEIFEKPKSADDVRRFCQAYNHYSAQTITALAVTNTVTKQQVSGIDIATVFFYTIPKESVDAMIAEGEVFCCAGGFQIETKDGGMNPYIKSVDGDIDSVKGLPMRLLKKLLIQQG